MQCKICNTDRVRIIFNDHIRNGKVGVMTETPVVIYQCENCKTIWHKGLKEEKKFYQDGVYRQSMGEHSESEEFYRLHDAESMEKFKYTGTTIFRNKTVADIGCGGGAFLDYLHTVAKKVIAVEPDATYREDMKNRRNYEVFPDMGEALKGYAGKVDVVVSFDVIEHVEDPIIFLMQMNDLLRINGIGICGTPTDAPVMRQLLGNNYESFLFSMQHPWILSKESFKYMAEKIGIKSYKIKFYQRYGLGNFIFWLLNKAPGRHTQYNFVSSGMDGIYKSELERQELADYIIFEFNKN